VTGGEKLNLKTVLFAQRRNRIDKLESYGLKVVEIVSNVLVGASSQIGWLIS
jgi:hypothetical protein